MKKKKTIIGSLILITIIIVGLIGTSLASPNSSTKIQNVDGLSFENATIEYNKKYSTFTVDVYNENKTTYNMKSIDITLIKNNDDKVTLTYQIDSLESDEGRKIIIDRIEYDLSEYSKIKYKVNK